MYNDISNTSLHEDQQVEHQDLSIEQVQYQKYLNAKHELFEKEYHRFMDQYVNLQEMLTSTNGVIYTAETTITKEQPQQQHVVMKKIWKDRIATVHTVKGDERECPNEIWYHIKAAEASPKSIIPLLDWFEFEDFYLAVMPKIEGARDLFQLLQQEGPLDERRAKSIFRQLVRVCDDLNRNGICHRDIKDENVLIDPFDNIYVIDFGTTMDWESSYSDLVGTECFFSPEYFDRGYFRPEQLTVWSLGAVLYMLIVRCWRYSRETQTWHRCANDERHLSSSAIRLIDQVLNPIPEERATLADMVNAEWLKC
jgi:serine/threonine protein kinase